MDDIFVTQPFTARHVRFTKKMGFGSLGNNPDVSRPLYTSYDETHSDERSACLVHLTTFTEALPSKPTELTQRVTATHVAGRGICIFDYLVHIVLVAETII